MNSSSTPGTDAHYAEARLAEYEQRQNQMVAGFNVYRMPAVQEALPDLHVCTWYRGMRIEGTATVTRIDDAGVCFELGAEHARAVRHAGFALVESPLHGTCFRARLSRTEGAGTSVQLSFFEPFKDYMERRRSSRVPPDHAMLVRLAHGRHRLSGRVVDLSVSTLGALFDGRSLDHLPRLREVEVEVWGEPQGETPLVDFNASGRVLTVKTEKGARAEAKRVVIGLNSYPALVRTLNTYIARRERELMWTLAAEEPHARPGERQGLSPRS